MISGLQFSVVGHSESCSISTSLDIQKTSLRLRGSHALQEERLALTNLPSQTAELGETKHRGAIGVDDGRSDEPNELDEPNFLILA